MTHVRCMRDFDSRLADDIAVTANGIRLRRNTLQADSTPRHLRNDSDVFLVMLPLENGHVRVEGTRNLIYEGAVQPGAVRIVQPGEQVILTVKVEFERAILYIPGQLFREHAKPMGMRIEDNVCPEMVPLIRSIHAVQRLAPLFEITTGMSPMRQQLLVQGLATTVMSLLFDMDLHRSQSLAVAFGQAQFEQVLHFAEQRLDQHLDLAEWASIVGLPVGEFTRRFQRHTGAAPYAWFMDRRIELAKRLMVQGDISLVDVALEAGFCSQSHFTETFRRRVGTSPGRWRKARSQTGASR